MTELADMKARAERAEAQRDANGTQLSEMRKRYNEVAHHYQEARALAETRGKEAAALREAGSVLQKALVQYVEQHDLTGGRYENNRKCCCPECDDARKAIRQSLRARGSDAGKGFVSREVVKAVAEAVREACAAAVESVDEDGVSYQGIADNEVREIDITTIVADTLRA